LREEPRGATYTSLIEAARAACREVSLIQRGEGSYDAESARILRELAPYLLEERAVSEWPGTKLLSAAVPATLRKYPMSEGVLGVVAGAVSGLYEWNQPSRPEDLVFWRRDGEPWLVTIAHERDGYLVLTEVELRSLKERIPTLHVEDQDSASG
jgi:hypothetical protein